MKHLLSILILVLCCLFTMPAGAQSTAQSYNLKKAAEAFQNEDYEKGASYVKKELDANPKNGYAWYLQSGLYALQEDTENAIDAMTKAVKFIPDGDAHMLLNGYKDLAALYLSIDNQAKAREAYDAAIKRLPGNIDALNEKADFCTGAGEDIDGAISCYEQMLKLDPSDLDALNSLALCYSDKGDMKKAEDYCNQALKLDDENADTYMVRGLIRLQQERAEEAISDMAIGAEKDDDYISKLTELADSAELRPMVLKKVEETAEKVGTDSWWNTLAQIHENNKEYAEALTAYTKGFEKNKTYDNAMNIAQIYLLQNDYDPTMLWTDKAIALARDSADEENIYNGYIAKGKINTNFGRYNDAMTFYDKAIEKDGDQEVAFYVKALIYIYLGDNDKALQTMNEAVKRCEEDDPYDLAYRGWLYLQAGKTMEAEADFRKAIIADSTGTPGLGTLISQHFLGIDEQAKASARRILNDEFWGKQGQTHVNVAMLYALLGDKPMAMREIQAGIELGYNSWYDLRDNPFLKLLKGYPDYDELLKEKIKN